MFVWTNVHISAGVLVRALCARRWLFIGWARGWRAQAHSARWLGLATSGLSHHSQHHGYLDIIIIITTGARILQVVLTPAADARGVPALSVC